MKVSGRTHCVLKMKTVEYLALSWPNIKDGILEMIKLWESTLQEDKTLRCNILQHHCEYFQVSLLS